MYMPCAVRNTSIDSIAVYNVRAMNDVLPVLRKCEWSAHAQYDQRVGYMWCGRCSAAQKIQVIINEEHVE